MDKTRHKLSVPFKYESKIISKSSDVRIYRNAELLHPGEFSDSITRAPVIYTASTLQKGATNWTEDFLDIDHSWGTLDRIGRIKNPRGKNGTIYADLHIYPITQRAKDTIALIDAGIVNSLSVELMSNDRWDPEDSKRYADDIEFIGCAVCTHPADSQTRIR